VWSICLSLFFSLLFFTGVCSLPFCPQLFLCRFFFSPFPLFVVGFFFFVRTKRILPFLTTSVRPPFFSLTFFATCLGPLLFFFFGLQLSQHKIFVFVYHDQVWSSLVSPDSGLSTSFFCNANFFKILPLFAPTLFYSSWSMNSSTDPPPSHFLDYTTVFPFPGSFLLFFSPSLAPPPWLYPIISPRRAVYFLIVFGPLSFLLHSTSPRRAARIIPPVKTRSVTGGTFFSTYPGSAVDFFPPPPLASQPRLAISKAFLLNLFETI